MNAVFATIKKDLSKLVVPRHVMSHQELDELIDGLIRDDVGNPTYQMHRKRFRYMGQWVEEAEKAITGRSGFTFDGSVPVLHAQ